MNLFTYKGYTGEWERDPVEGVIVGHVIGMRDVITFEADTVEQAEHEFRESVEDYLEFCRELGEPPEQPKLVETGAGREGEA